MNIQKQSFTKTLQLIGSDMQYRCIYEHKTLTFMRVLGFLTNQTVLSQILYRLQIFFYTHHLSLIASLIKSINSIIFTVTIDNKTNIGEGLLLLHANYIAIGKNVTLGKQCILVQQNTIGPAYTLETTTPPSEQGPTIGDNVLFGVGCAVFGEITIGSNSKISINSAVDKSFPENAMLVGVPAKNLQLT